MSKVVLAKDEKVRIFKSDFFEFFTHVYWWLPLVLYIPILLYFSWKAFFLISLGKVLLTGIIGIFAWTFIEYLLHRFVFHFKPHCKSLKRIFYLLHQIHHDYPNNSSILPTPPAMSLPIGILFYFLFWLILPSGFFEAFFIGFGIGYLNYDMTHYAIHNVNLKSRWLRFLKKYHLYHHFQEEDRGFGVFSPLWDFIFQTQPCHKD